MRGAYGSYYNHPHIVVLQYVYDLGVIAGLVAITLLLLLGFRIWKLKSGDPASALIAITAFGAISSTAIIDSPLFHPLPIVIAIALISPIVSRPYILVLLRIKRSHLYNVR